MRRGRCFRPALIGVSSMARTCSQGSSAPAPRRPAPADPPPDGPSWSASSDSGGPRPAPTLMLAVERKVEGELVDEKPRQEAHVRAALLQNRRRSRRTGEHAVRSSACRPCARSAEPRRNPDAGPTGRSPSRPPPRSRPDSRPPSPGSGPGSPPPEPRGRSEARDPLCASAIGSDRRRRWAATSILRASSSPCGRVSPRVSWRPSGSNTRRSDFEPKSCRLNHSTCRASSSWDCCSS